MPTILVVDDSAVDRLVTGALLAQDAELEVQYANNGQEALDSMAERLPDLVISDLMMPRLDGLGLVAAIRDRYPRVPVILMTSQGSEEIAVRALQEGAASYVPKGLIQSYLADTIEKVLRVTHQEKCRGRLMGSMVRSHSLFCLESDPALLSPLVTHLQEGFSRMGLCNDTDQVRVGVALQEALSNALYHGNLEVSSELRDNDSEEYERMVQCRRSQSPYRERRIEVEVTMDRSEATIMIRDEGPGFNFAALPDPTDPANLEKVSGRGILLMQTFMDETLYNASGNSVTLVKRRPQAAKDRSVEQG